jgi:hypothetical protein
MTPASDPPRVFIVHLRRPTGSVTEMRSDPFWEFGSFGCTGCHRKNLLNPRKSERLDGARLAFAQGGADGFKLVLLTPPVVVQRLGDRVELRWQPALMPFKYTKAPVLVANDGGSDFPMLKKMVNGTLRSTIEGGFSSSFRTRTFPLVEQVASELLSVYEARRKRATTESICETYDQALPYPPPLPDRNREKTYNEKRLGESPVTKPRSTSTGVHPGIRKC